MRIRVGFSADPDDAFMFWGLASGTVDARGFEFEPVIEDIQTLNALALEGRLEVTAMSLRDVPARARPLHAPAARREHRLRLRADRRRARAALARRAARARDRRARRADDGVPRPAHGARRRVPAPRRCRSTRSSPRSSTAAPTRGLLIHEGQLTYRDHGSHKCLDLGEWWLLETGLPLPLGVNTIRRDLGDEAMRDAVGDPARVDRRRHSRTARRRSSTRSASAAAWTPSAATEFVGMYVNELTLRLRRRGAAGRARAARARRHGARWSSSNEPQCAAAPSSSTGVRTPIGRYGGALAGVRPDDLAAHAIRGGRRALGRARRPDRGRLVRLREPGGRGQPQRRAHGARCSRGCRSRSPA